MRIAQGPRGGLLAAAWHRGWPAEQPEIGERRIMQRRGNARDWALVGVLLLSAAGCGRMTATTVVRADGVCTRTLKFSAPRQEAKGDLQLVPKLDDVFIVPGGAEWKVVRTSVGADSVCTATRTFKVGDVLDADVFLKAGSKKPGSKLIVGSVSVTRPAPGVLQYREVLKWVGERPKEFTSIDPEIAAIVRSALPPALVTDVNVQKVSRALYLEFWRMVFGPGDPLLATAVMHPDLAQRQMTGRMRQAADAVAASVLGQKMSPEQRRAFAERVTARAVEMANMPSRGQARANEDTSNGGDLTPLLYVVDMPGAITSSNGKVEGHEVYWALYSTAAAASDVVLTATCTVGK